MKDLQITRRQILKGAGAAGVLGALAMPTGVLADEDTSEHRVRWDIPSIDFTVFAVNPGGHASARSNDGDRITITGSGTFPNVRNKCRRDVTGGGTWRIPSASDPRCFSGSGTYNVVELLSWTPAATKFPLPHDNIGEIEDATSGLAKLRVAYSNDTHGVLTVSCELSVGAAGAPPCIFEGITASMEWEDFWSREAPAPGVDANRTVFHFVRREED
jgi:TAT (twin-arginine translocation) pathway signal sequence